MTPTEENMPTTAHFTLAYWCVLIAALLPLVCATLAKKGGFGRAPNAGGYDNHAPREWLARQQGAAARANAAQANTFEALPFFIGAVIIAHQLGAAAEGGDGFFAKVSIERTAGVVGHAEGSAIELQLVLQGGNQLATGLEVAGFNAQLGAAAPAVEHIARGSLVVNIHRPALLITGGDIDRGPGFGFLQAVDHGLGEIARERGGA
jgi:uncharacterized MAPEG superfamily protein